MIQLQISIMRPQVYEIWRIVIFIFKILDSLMDSPSNYEEMFTEIQLIILFYWSVFSSVHH
jgi:hypothetical protein